MLSFHFSAHNAQLAADLLKDGVLLSGEMHVARNVAQGNPIPLHFQDGAFRFVTHPLTLCAGTITPLRNAKRALDDIGWLRFLWRFVVRNGQCFAVSEWLRRAERIGRKVGHLRQSVSGAGWAGEPAK